MAEIVKDTRATELQKVQEEILIVLEQMSHEIEGFPKTDGVEHKAQNLEQLIGHIKDSVFDLEKLFTEEESRPIESFQRIPFYELFDKEADIGLLKPDASGNYGKVMFCDFRGQKVAVKIQKRSEEEESDKKKSLAHRFKEEISTLRVITHENIISFRGWGEHQGLSYLVMEHLDKNLEKYVKEQSSDENEGLSSRITWAIAKQIAQAMLYLHSLESPICHGDLKPDNILVDTKPIIPKPKICDFGLARHDFANDGQRGHVFYLPKNQELEEVKTMEDRFKIDVFAYGLVVLFMRSGKSPYSNKSNGSLINHVFGVSSPLQRSTRYYVRHVVLPPDLPTTVLGDLIKKCCRKADQRPTFKGIEEEYFGKRVENPFNLSENGEFFECGFLKDTQIFIASSTVKGTEVDTSKPSDIPPGFRSEDLLCLVDVKDKPYDNKPDDKKLLELYEKHHKDFKKKAEQKLIDDNPSVALTALMTNQSDDDDTQRVELRFKEKTYCHHRAMREIWRSFEPQRKRSLVPDLKVVHPLYSTSFGLHVAILTNEGPGNTKKFVFTKRSNIPGRASPGTYTCGAVQRCSGKDLLKPDTLKDLIKDSAPGFEYVSLLDIAARGLDEELGLPLQGSDKEAIALNTIYLKFDNHEWGMCGFVDLTSEKIREKNRFSFEKLNSAFTAGPKSKYKHSQIYGVDFELRNMVEWIRENHDKLASSTKVVVVKVLQAFFGINAVIHAFKKKM